MYNSYMISYIKTYLKYLKKVWSKPSEGFGDTFAKITKTFGIKPCGGCERRRKDWNKRLAYAKKQRELEKEKSDDKS